MRLSDLSRSLRFIILWIPANLFALIGTGVATIAIFVGGGIVAGLLWRGREIASVETLIFAFTIYSLIGLTMGLLFGSLQKGLLRQYTDDPFRGWLIASMIGGVLGVNLAVLIVMHQLAPYLMWMIAPPPETLFGIGLLLATVPVALIGLAQTVVLFRMVHGAWTWTLANIVGGIVLFSLLRSGVIVMGVTPLFSLLILLLVIASPGIVTGFAMLWLLNYNLREG